MNSKNNTIKCTWCGKRIKEEDFRDDIAIREWRLSGACQKCQDETFGK